MFSVTLLLLTAASVPFFSLTKDVMADGWDDVELTIHSPQNTTYNTYSTIQFGTLRYDTIQYNTVQYNTPHIICNVLCCTHVLYCTVLCALYCTVLCCIVSHCMYCIVLCRIVLYRAVLYCSILYCIDLCFYALSITAGVYSIVNVVMGKNR